MPVWIERLTGILPVWIERLTGILPVWIERLTGILPVWIERLTGRMPVPRLLHIRVDSRNYNGNLWNRHPACLD
jgi:hypothetical protein